MLLTYWRLVRIVYIETIRTSFDQEYESVAICIYLLSLELLPLLGHRPPTTTFQRPCPWLFSEADVMCSPSCWCVLRGLGTRCFLVFFPFPVGSSRVLVFWSVCQFIPCFFLISSYLAILKRKGYLLWPIFFLNVGSSQNRFLCTIGFSRL